MEAHRHMSLIECSLNLTLAVETEPVVLRETGSIVFRARGASKMLSLTPLPHFFQVMAYFSVTHYLAPKS